MSDEATTPPEGGDTPPLAGERLAEARRARDMSVEDVARQLHLDEHKVAALEQNRFDDLGAAVFAKGYLRKYAALVGVPVDEILADYTRLNHSPGTTLVIPYRPRPPTDFSPGPWLAGLLAVIVVAGAAWWWLASDFEWSGGDDDASTLAPFAGDRDAGEQSAGQGARVTQTLPAPDEPGPQGGDQEEDAASIEATAPPVAGDLQPARSTEPSQPGGQAVVELGLTFTGDCWTEVTDAEGERLFFGLGSDGRQVTVSGEPPLQVLLGDSANVSLSVNGANYPIPRSARRGATARLTITDL